MYSILCTGYCKVVAHGYSTLSALAYSLECALNKHTHIKEIAYINLYVTMVCICAFTYVCVCVYLRPYLCCIFERHSRYTRI